MKKSNSRKLFAVILSILLLITSVPAAPNQVSAEAPSILKKFDFGTPTSAVKDGYLKVSSDTAYSAETGYGFADISKVTSTDRSTSDHLNSDFILTTETPFNVDLPNGDYSVTVIAGDDTEVTEVGVKAENIQKIQNTTIPTGQHIERKFEIALIDGQFNFEFTGATPKINGIIIEKVSERTAGELPTVYIAGDSTVQTYDEYWRPEAGWGQMIPRYFSSDVTFKNQAIGGRSTKSFINEGRLDNILREIKPKDYFLIQFGHNDATVSLPDRYASVPDYKNYLKTYINGARQRGATPILVTPVGRRDFNTTTGKFNVSFPEYVQGMQEVAAEMNVDVVDLSARSVAYYDTIGPEGSLSVFLHTDPGVYTAFPNGSQDNTHFQEYGAIQLARLVSDEIKNLNIPLSRYVTGIEPPATVPGKPTDVEVSSISNAGALVTWKSIDGADIYRIYRKLSTDSEYKSVGTSTIPQLNITGMEEGKTYDVYVTAVNGKGESEISDVKQFTTKKATLKFDFGIAGSPVAEGFTEVNLSTLYTPQRGYGIVDATGMIGRDRKTGDNLVRDWLGYFNIGWKFNVDVPNGLYALKVYVGDLTGSARTTLAVEGQDYGTISSSKNNYTTKVVSQVSVKDEQMNFSFGGQTGIVNAVEITPILIAPSNLKVDDKSLNAENPYVTLSWKPVEDAVKYNVYRKVAGTSDFILVGSSKTTSYTDSTVDVGMEYQYVATTVDNTDVETDPSLPLKVVMVDPSKPVPAKPGNLQVGEVNKNDLTISWDQVEGAITYNVYRSKKANGTFEFIGKTKTISYKDETVLTTIPYFYKVSAVNAGGISELSDSLKTPAVTKLKRQMEDIDRAPVAMKTEEGVFVSWRMLGTDPEGVSFNVYRDGEKVNSKPITTSTNYVDKEGKSKSTYEVRAVIDGKERKSKDTTNVLNQNYMDIPLQKPADGVTPLGDPYSYRANDASIGDLDADGKYELVLKWDPTNSKDNSQAGYTGNVYVDAYEMDGTLKWRIDLGKNIRAGAHYSPFLVYDFDGDGKAEIVFKTADGTTDGQGTVIGKADADHRNSSGYVLQGAEYLTVFEGETGKALTTTDYEPPRGDVGAWGDSYGNRVDRFLAAVAYLDGETPSIIMARGYYTRTVLTAYQFKKGKLTKQWLFDSNDEEHRDYAGQGYHNLSVADIDKDGKDEIVYGQAVIDDDGKGIYTTGLGHGDAQHVSDLDPTRPGLEVFAVQEHTDSPYGYDMRDAETGEILWGVKTGQDTGRGVAADIDPRYEGAEAWAISGAWNSQVGGLYSAQGQKISENIPSSNFAIWWDGDLSRELVDHKWNDTTSKGVGTIDKWDYENNKLVNILTVEGTQSNNGTKGNPVLQADLFGDWREEIIWRTDDSSALKVYMTTEETENRIYTLMNDPQYRLSIAWQNVGYNQPPHTSFFLGTGMSKPPVPSIDVVEIPDVNAPETEHEVRGEVQEGWYHNPVTVNLTGYDYQSGIKATYFSLNGSAEQEGNTVSITEDGRQVLEYWSVDKAGNIEPKKTVEINIDKSAPDITFTVEDGTEFKVDTVMSITCKVADELSGVASSTCEDVSIPAYELGLGSHTFKADAQDVAGNRLTKSVTIHVVVDFDSLGRLTGFFLTETSGDRNILGSLTAKLNSAKASEEKGNKGARDGQLNAYINEVKAKTNKDFTEKQAQILKQYAESLMK
ncbi:fibronectin type III domain-containing protein [Bacillus sp. ISL-40]|uniref:rhamnogalacturonan lyase family protein n=1 Tax=unclassified Bacillus (in: firmicutes) TaxID=185979 RepID=UPI001BEB8FC2|nr:MULTISPECIES: SGNH/GDSL hydrolase family protein [unclassified Bacillus (in: firmicutes)]MBT2700931.1 fibronectin type III domain-containing protein [Bacillus sp. ISL-40]MBT2742971.1 fibronectin type III domain-containing protein [Bacillus sp. ISL-77]